ncbi:MAG TPA: hypothetical protein VGP26_19425 [Actinophytocola sp.]|jgi:hypothetical protein|nr:hypothetical protein [Actinophytocola sp.]
MTDPDLRTLRRDDRLLDRIGRGEQVDDGDVEAMLSTWRRTLPVAGPPDPRLVAAVTAPRVRPKLRVARTSLGVAVSVALLAGGLMVGAAYVNPDSPLWPVTGFVYGDVTNSRTALDDAKAAVADARTAIGRGRYADAGRLLATADELAAKVDDRGAAKRLRDDIAAVRAQLPPGPPTTSGSTTVRPTHVEAPPGDAAPRDTPPGQPSPDGHGGGHERDGGHEEHGPGAWHGGHDEEGGHERPHIKGKANKPRPHNLAG